MVSPSSSTSTISYGEAGGDPGGVLGEGIAMSASGESGGVQGSGARLAAGGGGGCL